LTICLSNGKGNPPVVIPWAWGTPVQVEIGWDGKQYELRATYEVGNTSPKEESPKEEGKEGNEEEKREGGVAGVDLGEVHLTAAHDGEQTYLVNGRLLRSKRRFDILPALKGKDSFPGCRVPYSLGYTTLALASALRSNGGGGCHNPNYWA